MNNNFKYVATSETDPIFLLDENKNVIHTFDKEKDTSIDIIYEAEEWYNTQQVILYLNNNVEKSDHTPVGAYKYNYHPRGGDDQDELQIIDYIEIEDSDGDTEEYELRKLYPVKQVTDFRINDI